MNTANLLRFPKAFLLCWLIVLSTNAAANGAYDVIPGKRIYLKNHALFLASSLKPNSPEEIVSRYLDRRNLWKKTYKISFLGAFQAPFSWKKITLHNPTNHKLELFYVCDEPTARLVVTALVKNGVIDRQWKTGTLYPYSQRPVEHRSFLIPFDIHAGETVTLLTGTTVNPLSNLSWIEQRSDFWHHDTHAVFFDGIYFGAIGILSLLILILYFVQRNTTYFYFYCFVFFCGIHNLARDGYLQQLLAGYISNISESFAEISLNLLFLFFILFIVSFLEFRERNRRYMLFMAYGYFSINIVTTFSSLMTPASIHTNLVIVTGFLSITYVLISWTHSLACSFRGHLRSAFFAIAALLYVFPVTLAAAKTQIHGIQQVSIWLNPRNGELLMTVALYIIQLFELRREQIAKQAALLEAEARTNFFAMMSHELRTPLNGVIGMAELLHQTRQTPTQRQYSEIIISSGNVLLTLINDILDLTKISEKKLELENSPYDLDQMLMESVSTFLPLILKKNLPLLIDFQPDMPFCYFGDQYRIRQVIYNLLSNAMKFTEKGHILISAKVENKSKDRDIVNIILSVSDTGVGINANTQEKIFKQFSQADASTTRRFGGTGLGLAICKAIVEEMGGTISVESEQDKGSTFTVRYPAQIDANSERRRRQMLSTLAGKRLIALGDYRAYYDSVINHMRDWGIDVEIVTNTQTATRKLQIENYDGIIAFYTSNPESALQPFLHFDLPLLILHYAPIEHLPQDRRAKTLTLPVPSPLLKFGLSIKSMFEESLETAIEANSDLFNGNWKNTTALVVEDNITNQLVALGMLNTLGLKADIAENGKQAVAMCQEQFYPLIFMDCEMPIMDGYEATEIILRQSSGKKPVIIALTAQSMDAASERCFSAGMDYILHKPVTLKKLEDCLRKLYPSPDQI